jgi:tocopherol O-methyltransferase
VDIRTGSEAGGQPAATVHDLHQAVGRYYDETIELYDDLWGDHIHHGYWDPDDLGVDRHSAQQRTVRELVAFAGFARDASVLDAGCGVGGPAVQLAAEYGCVVDGITLSGKQVERAGQKAAAAGVGGRTTFRVRDALATGFPDGSFDVVWALESLELMADKGAFFAEASRVLRPGGTLALTTWCVREGSLPDAERRLLRTIYQHYELPYILDLPAYARMTREHGFTDVRAVDWSASVRHTYDPDVTLVRRLDTDRSFIMDLARERGVGILRFFRAIPLMKRAYDLDVLRYGAIRATKPA